MNATLKMVSQNNISQQDLGNLDQQDIDVYMHEESENEDTAEEEDGDLLLTISNHLTTPNDDLLFLVNNRWDNYAVTLQKCGYNAINQYMSENKLVNIYGKSASAQNNKILKEKQETTRRKRINDIKMHLNRKKRKSGNKKKDGNIEIVGHKLSAAGTLYDVVSPDGKSKKILHRTLMNTAPTSGSCKLSREI